MALRHAGSPVSAPERLSRARQDTILLWANVVTRMVARRSGIKPASTFEEDIPVVRANLRLDDPVLDDLIAQGGHRHAWESAPDRARAYNG